MTADFLERQEASVLPLDALSPAELDALPFGVVQLDREGRITFYSAGESRFSGRTSERVLGRDFFQEVAPCTNVPNFRARFLEGVRRGRLDERFEFVFGFEPEPVRVDVQLTQAVRADRYWMVIRPLSTLAPTAQRSAEWAIEAVDRRSRAEPVDPTLCEREPIHVPGGIQPYMVMLACDPSSPALTVSSCSDNVAEALAREPQEVLGRALREVAPATLADAIERALASSELPGPAIPLRLSTTLGVANTPYAVAVHQHDARIVVELERAPERPEDFGAATPLQGQDAVAALRRAGTLEHAAQVAAAHLRGMTGFERVLVYRFDADWNGEAIAEDKTTDWEQALAGLRFPASDIPAQARALYTRTPSRFVVDRDAVPAALLVDAQAGNRSVDLTYAQARALSPVHLEYQRNLGVNGSMSISIMVEGGLWGLIIGHHRRPHYVTPETRALAALVTDAFALRVHELETVDVWRQQQAHLQLRNRLLEKLATSEDYDAAVTEGEVSLPELIHAEGAAVVSGSRIATVGRTPPTPALARLADRMRRLVHEGEQVFSTDRFSSDSELAEFADPSSSGLLAVFVEPTHREDLLMWFRPEVVSTVVWGGDPNKPVMAESVTRTILPRRSFERWVEERRGVSEPWRAWEVGAARALAAAIAGVALRQGRIIAELTAREAALTRALEQKDLLAREVDHRVKNSLQIVAGVMLMQSRSVTEPRAKAGVPGHLLARDERRSSPRQPA